MPPLLSPVLAPWALLLGASGAALCIVGMWGAPPFAPPLHLAATAPPRLAPPLLRPAPRPLAHLHPHPGPALLHASQAPSASAAAEPAGATVGLRRAVVVALAAVGMGAGLGLHARPDAAMTMGAAGEAASTPEPALLVVGCGVLGTMVARQWRETHGPAVKVVGQTRTLQSHARLLEQGIEPQVAGAALGRTYPHVIFCAPPGAQADYVEAVTAAAAQWDGTGQFVFTSSAGVYAEDDGGIVTEGSPVQSGNPRTSRLLAAEGACRAAGGCVVRLAGLYTADRGPHPYWLKMPEVQGRGDGLINMVAYEDAAAACVRLLQRPDLRRETFLVSDGVPITREDICRSARKLNRYAPLSMPTFVAAPGGVGKRYDVGKARSVLGWAPTAPSFEAFMTRLAEAEAQADSVPAP